MIKPKLFNSLSDSLKKTFYIFQKEIHAYFTSPVAYSVLTVFTIISGVYFYIVLSHFYTRFSQYQVYAQIYKNPEMLNRINLNEFVVAPLFQFLIIVMIFVIPAITMRLVSEEKKSKTDELLFTAPLSLYNIVIGKFLGSLFFLFVMLSVTFIYTFVLLHYGDPELGPIISGYVGLLLVGTVLISIGLFASSLTANQITAYFVSFAVGLLLLITGWAGQLTSSNIGKVLAYLSITEHYQELAKGVFDTKDIIYYLSFIIFFVFLTKGSLETSKWR